MTHLASSAGGGAGRAVATTTRKLETTPVTSVATTAVSRENVLVTAGERGCSSLTELLTRRSSSNRSQAESEHLSKAFDWILQKGHYSRTNYQGLAKRLPEDLRQALENGQVPAEEIVDRLSRCYRPKLDITSTGETNIDPLQFLAVRLVDMALQSPATATGRMVIDAALRKELVADVQQTFDRVTSHQIQEFMATDEIPDGPATTTTTFLPTWQRALDETLMHWSHRLDAAMYPTKPAGTFSRLCPVLRISQAKFQRKLQAVMRDVHGTTLVRDYEISRQKEVHFLEAVHSIQAGLHTVKKQCWECSKNLDKQELLACSLCNTAIYCGKVCQRRAWKTGHKHACTFLKSAQIQSVLDWNTVEHQHQQQLSLKPQAAASLMPGTTTLCFSDVVDYKLLPLLVRVSAVIPEQRLSMAHYYVNLCRVFATNEFWLFSSNRTTDDQEKFQDKDDEDIVMTVICILLCIDDFSTQPVARWNEIIPQICMQVWASRGDVSLANTAETALQWVHRITAVTASRFVAWYQAPENMCRTARDQTLHKRQQKAHVLKTLQKVHHKQSLPVLTTAAKTI